MNQAITNATLADYSNLKDGDAFRAPLSHIISAPWGNIRKSRDPKAFADLRAAIRNANGVTQGVTVRIDPEDPSKLQLLAGYGRVEASRIEGFGDVPVVFKVADDKQAEAIMMSENLDREDLSIADEIVASQRFISYFDGDYETAAADLNWSVKKLRGRLTLNQCTERVLDALRDNQIAIGHAEILSAFVPKLQDGTLEKIIGESWSVEYLKERAGKANRWIKNAIFDTTDCTACPHNSDVQAELFDNTVGKAKCNNLVCFKEKTDAALSVRKAELEEEYGVVLLAIEKPDSDRNTVSAETVGNDQFDTGCTGCVSNVVIMRDGINADAGQILTNQCIDTECFRKMRSANQVVDAKPTKSNASKKSAPTRDNPKSNTGAGGKKAGTPNAPSTQKTPGPVIENNKAVLRGLAAKHFDTNSHFMEAILVSSLIDQSGFSHDTGRFKSAANAKLSSNFNARVLELYALSNEALDEVKLACYSAYLTDSNQGSTEPRALMITALANDSSGKDIAIKGWTPTKEILNAYLKQGLLMIAKKSGLSAQYDSDNGEGAFSKIEKKPKGELIEAMLRTKFDWSSFAPDDYIKTLK